MNSAVIKLSNVFYVDQRDVSSVSAFEDDQRNWTILNVKGIETYIDLPIEEVLTLIHWRNR